MDEKDIMTKLAVKDLESHRMSALFSYRYAWYLGYIYEFQQRKLKRIQNKMIKAVNVTLNTMCHCTKCNWKGRIKDLKFIPVIYHEEVEEEPACPDCQSTQYVIEEPEHE